MTCTGKGKGSGLGLNNWINGEKWSMMLLNKLRKLGGNRIVGEEARVEVQVGISGRHVSSFSGGWFFSDLSTDLGQGTLGKEKDSFKCAQTMMDS